MKMPIMLVYGTRPEAIKMAPIVKALEASEHFSCVVVVTGQHRGMLDQINAGFGVVPAHDLDVFAHGQGPDLVAARTMQGLSPILEDVAPAAVLVQGDTSSALAAGLSAFYHRIPVVHVEAGLRTESIRSPFPEEGNRRALTHITDLHLTPTEHTRKNLLSEGVDPDSIVVTGNTVIDALLLASTVEHTPADPVLMETLRSPRRLVLVTSHRRESWGAPMERVARALHRLAASEPDVDFVFPLHANPVVRESFAPLLTGLDNFRLTEPLDYLDFAHLLRKSALVLTDSGGIQEEAPSLGKPLLVMREDTERGEGVAAGAARLVGTDEDLIVDTAQLLLHDEASYAQMSNAVNPYGDGRAAARTVAALDHLFGRGARLSDFRPHA
ncbi:non-hydrolyzing UDP-N-acetylglucosamine 2-epimerase [Luteimicrobium sp. NPDC057192]|uniref:non-hydrolyzing UDP-N-acetylglucosamine 2-epimerase n=1 Tax=Luteimicrobium sp. NPDC057192 TaxID=3346042 RepID=UPI00363E855D